MADVPHAAPLAPMQRVLAGPSIVVGGAVRLEGPLDTASVARAARAVCRAHPALRTTVHLEEGEQFEHPFDEAFVLVVELEAAGRGEVLEEVSRAGVAEIDPSAPPVLRCVVARVAGGGETVVHLAAPHAVCDRSSLVVVFRDFLRALDATRGGGDSGPVPGGVSLADHARERAGRYRDPLTWASGPGASAVRFWSERLSGARLPRWGHPPRTAPRRLDAMAVLHGALTPALTQRMRQRCEDLGCSLYHLVLAAYEEAVASVTGTLDVVTVSLVHGRWRPDLAEAVGLYVDEVVFRRRVRADSRADHLRAVAADVLSSYLHQGIPLPVVAEHSPEVASVYAQRRFRSMVIQYRPQGVGDQAVPVAGLRTEFLQGLDGSAGWRLPGFAILSVDDLHRHLAYELMYDPTLWDGEQLQRLLHDFERSCAEFAAPGDAPLQPL